MHAATDDEGPTSDPAEPAVSDDAGSSSDLDDAPADDLGPPAPEARPDPVTDERTGSTIGNYVLHERLGRGGMAAVYRAVHRGFEELVAIKLLAPRYGAQPEMLRRFLREAVVMREISARNHHVVRALDFGQTATGEAYLVMDYLTGQDLQQLLATVGPLSWPRVAPLALQLCDALATTHAHGIIHRDIKPSNCLLTDDSGEQRLKLIDFGVAKDLEAPGDQTADNVILGTPSYLAPELLTVAAEPDARSDIYALGATLYCLLTGHPPYIGRGHSEIAHKQRHEAIVPPSAARPPGLPKVPASVDALILRALHLDPDQRFQSVMDLADEIRHTLEPGPGTRQLAGAPLGLRAAWLATIVASAAVALGIGVDPPRPPPRSFASGGVPLALVDSKARPRPPVPTHPVPQDSLVAAAAQPSVTPAFDPPVPTDSPIQSADSAAHATPDPSAQPALGVDPAGSPPAPSDSPAITPQPAPSDSPANAPANTQPAPQPAPSDSPANAPANTPPQPTPQPAPSDSPAIPPQSAPQPAPSDSPAGAPQPAPSDSPATPPQSAPATPPSAPPVDPRQQKVRRLLDKQRETLRRECLNLSGGAKRLRFTLILSRGQIEAVTAQPATFRECVRSTLKHVAFGVDGQYEYTFSAR